MRDEHNGELVKIEGGCIHIRSGFVSLRAFNSKALIPAN